jgi:hypothetical protein
LLRRYEVIEELIGEVKRDSEAAITEPASPFAAEEAPEHVDDVDEVGYLQANVDVRNAGAGGVSISSPVVNAKVGCSGSTKNELRGSASES